MSSFFLGRSIVPGVRRTGRPSAMHRVRNQVGLIPSLSAASATLVDSTIVAARSFFSASPSNIKYIQLGSLGLPIWLSLAAKMEVVAVHPSAV